MKKNLAMRVASLVLMCTIVTSCFVSSTFAKYTSSASGTDSVTVAKWSVKVDGTDITTSDTVTFNLFDTANLKDSDGTSAESDVSADRIAPGTTGSFGFAIKNDSEVSVTYAVTYDLYTDANCTQKLADDIITTADTGLNAASVSAGASANPTVTWEWKFDRGDDAEDMSLAGKTVYVKATITATQVD